MGQDGDEEKAHEKITERFSHDPHAQVGEHGQNDVRTGERLDLGGKGVEA